MSFGGKIRKVPRVMTFCSAGNIPDQDYPIWWPFATRGRRELKMSQGQLRNEFLVFLFAIKYKLSSHMSMWLLYWEAQK